MKPGHCSKQEITKCLDAKRMLQNCAIYFGFYIIFFSLGYFFMLWGNQPTLGLIIIVISSIVGVVMVSYHAFRLFRLLNGCYTMECFIVTLDKVNNYMGGMFPVFAVAIPTEDGTKVVETNAIYKKKDVAIYQGHQAKILYDAKKNRIHIITLVD